MEDKKYSLILNHYREIIENKIFDEYDVMGLLIFLRSYMDGKNCKYIREFADLVAHRKRDKGLINKAIGNAIDNHYQVTGQKGKIKDYHGISEKLWEREWKTLGDSFCFRFSDDIIAELTLCIYSLTQFSSYEKGQEVLFQSKDGELALVTKAAEDDSPFVCFAKYGPFQFAKEYPAGYITEPVETVRENGRLRLRDKSGYII